MKGLLLKDFFTLVKQTKIFLLIIVVWACIPDFAAVPFAVVYGAIMPVTALAYDERAKWDALAAMMPYSARDLVVSKYLLGYGAMIGSALLAFVAQTAANAVRGAGFVTDGLSPFLTLGLGLCAGLLMQGILLPLVFRLGTEKGRLALFALVAIVTLGGMAVGAPIARALDAGAFPLGAVVACAAAFAVLFNAASVLLSIRFYRRLTR